MNKLRRFAVSLIAVGLLGLSSMPAHGSENRYVRVVNRASSAIRYFYASNVDRDVWEEDILGAFRVIFPDHYMNINVDDGTGHCLYDFKAVLADGRTAITHNVNVCTQESWTVTDGN